MRLSSVVLRQIRTRRGRSLGLALAIVVAATGFTVLTASARASELTTRGAVKANSTTVYDILVRPPSTQSTLERQGGLVQPGFLTGVYGGITVGQWQAIRHIQGVEVAAPIAILGYAFPDLTVSIPVSAAWSKHGNSLVRIDVEWTWDNGLTHVPEVPDFALLTSQALRPNIGSSPYSGEGSWLVKDREGVRDICPANLDPGRPDNRPESRQSRILCFSRTAGGDGEGSDFRVDGQRAVPIKFPLSYVIAAVDPQSEDALLGLTGAVTSGSGLVGATTNYPKSATGKGIPVLVADTTQAQITASVRVSQLQRSAAEAVVAGASQEALKPLRGEVRERLQITAQRANRLLMHQFRTVKPTIPPGSITRFMPGELWNLGQVSLPTIEVSSTPPTVEQHRPGKPDAEDLERGVQYRVPGSAELQARRIVTSYKTSTHLGPPDADTLYLRGNFDPAMLRRLEDVTAQVLAGFDSAPTVGADHRTRDLLGDQPLRPSGYLGSFVQPPPTMLTTLRASGILTRTYTRGHSDAPISAVRVRVAGVSGVDQLSRERVRLVAERIQAATGLQVDITTGSSATQKTVFLPPGSFGRPELTLSQWWVKKGVALSILNELDKKSLALFGLVLLVSAASVANSAVASVRSRRTDLGVLACIGWRPRHLFRITITELVFIALASAAMSFGLAWGIGRVGGASVSAARAALAIPAALVVAVTAGMVPAWLAARAEPMDAVRSVASSPRRPKSVTSVAAMARTSLGRVKARTMLASAGLGIAVVAFTVLLGITLAFQGAVVGTILGDAVAVQARPADYAATLATLMLAFIGVGNVMYLNIRDRGSELATLRAVGWSDSHLHRLLVMEGTWIGLLGATPGAIVGLALSVALTHQFVTTLVLGGLIAWTSAVLLASLAASAATALVRRLPTTVLLTE